MPIYDFQLAGKVIRLNHCRQIIINRNFEPFLVSGREPDCVVTFRQRDTLPFFTDAPLYSNVGFTAHRDGDGFTRQYIEYGEDQCPYALGTIRAGGKTELVEYLPRFSWAFAESQNTFSHIAIDELLLHHRRVILHASFIAAQLGGLLFSGPSKIGKSTQAELWADKEGCEIINGDRPILGKEDGVWRAWGSPYAGSSGYHVAKDVPIRAIVILGQAQENSIRRLPVAEAFKSLFQGMTVNTWNPWFVDRVVDLASDLAAAVPVYRLLCRPDAASVDLLKEELIRGTGDGCS